MTLAMSSPLVGRPNARSCLRGREGMSRYLGPEGKETTMPELLIDFITSLDGYASAEGWPGWWGLQGPEYLAWLDERPERDYTLLMGANTYRQMYGFASAPDSDFTEEERASIAELARIPKVVFSSTLEA